MSKSLFDGLPPGLVSIAISDVLGAASLRAGFWMFDPQNPSETLQCHEVEAGGPMVDVPAGWMISTSGVPPDAAISVGFARPRSDAE